MERDFTVEEGIKFIDKWDIACKHDEEYFKNKKKNEKESG